MITPQDIEQKVFTSALKGYKREEVDKFLDEIMMGMESLLAENERLKKNVADLQAEIQEHKQNESSVMETIEQAKSLMSDISESAEKRAEVIIKNAHADASRIVQDARESVANLTSQSDTMKSHLNTFRSNYKKLLKQELNRIDGVQNDLFADLRSDFYPGTELEEEPAPAVENDMQDPAIAAGLFSETISDEPVAPVRTPMDDLFSEPVAVQADVADEEPTENMTDKTLTDLVLEQGEASPDFDENAKTIVMNGSEAFLHQNPDGR